MAILNDIYKVYLTVNGQDILLPLTPDSIEISTTDKTKEETLVNGRPFTIAQLDGAQTFKFNFEIFNKPYPFLFMEGFRGIRFFTDLVWQIKQDRKPIELTILRTNGKPHTHSIVLLQDYSYTEDADNLSDYTFSVSFIEYYPQKNQELQTTETHHLLAAGESSGWNAEIKGAIQQAVGNADIDAQVKRDWQERRLRLRGV